MEVTSKGGQLGRNMHNIWQLNNLFNQGKKHFGGKVHKRHKTGISQKKKCKLTNEHMRKFNLISNQRNANQHNKIPFFCLLDWHKIKNNAQWWFG